MTIEELINSDYECEGQMNLFDLLPKEEMMEGYCVFCGRPAEAKHHLIFGRSERKLADADSIYIMTCHRCHNMADKACDRIHGNNIAESFSKMLGEAIWMLHEVADDNRIEEAKRSFMNRYGRNYL